MTSTKPVGLSGLAEELGTEALVAISLERYTGRKTFLGAF
jgi:hypothetical protein